MKTSLTSIFILFFAIFLKPAFAQSNEVCGFVKHYFNETPVTGVNLYIENSIVTTTTDEAGAFCLNLTETENKIWVEKEGYFKTYIIAKAGKFLSIQMIKNIEQNLAVQSGLSVEDIEALNTKKVRNKSFSKDEEVVFGMSEESAAPTMSAKSKVRSASKSLGAPGRPDASGAGGAHGSSAEKILVKESSSRLAAPAKSTKLGSPARREYSKISSPSTSSVLPASSKKRSVKSGDITVKGSRSDATDYYIDGKKVRDESEISEEIIETPKKEIKAGRLTAGEIHDFSKWDLWNDLTENELSKHKATWSVYPNKRYSVQAVTDEGFPVVDALVELRVGEEIVWQARTDNTGKVELWNLLFEKEEVTQENNSNNKQEKTLKANISYKGVNNSLQNLKPFKEGINVITFKQPCDYSKNVDIAFVVDATGSMGDEIDYLKVELLDVINKVQSNFEDLNIRLGNVFYRDKTDAYLTKNSPLTQNIKAGVAFIKDQRAGGGGDFPEAVEAGLGEAINDLKWSTDAVARIVFLVLDAPPHNNPDVKEKLQQITSAAAQKGIRIVPIVGSGIDKSTEYLLRSCALATNGHYVFLTDHSGIGGSHLEPSTDSYDVKNLNDLLVDIVQRYVKVEDCNTQKDDPTIIEPQPDKEVTVFPNPNDGRFLVKTKTDLKELFITDANGKILVRFTDFTTGENQVDIANFPTGTYYVRYEKDGKAMSEKVVIKR